MDVSRRQFLIGSLGTLAVAGCSSQGPTAALPPMSWPNPAVHPVPGRETKVAARRLPATGVLRQVLPRSQWTRRGPIKSRINPMGGISRITLHHEGSDPVHFDNYAETRDHFKLVQKSHVGRNFADIGYHFMIDRAGRIWEGRSLVYQGAHVSQNNEHNIGVMVLGNFDLQRPTNAQLQVMRAMVSELRRHYHVPIKRIYTHQELMPTRCPGTSLQPVVSSMRKGGQFA